MFFVEIFRSKFFQLWIWIVNRQIFSSSSETQTWRTHWTGKYYRWKCFWRDQNWHTLRSGCTTENSQKDWSYSRQKHDKPCSWWLWYNGKTWPKGSRILFKKYRRNVFLPLLSKSIQKGMSYQGACWGSFWWPGPELQFLWQNIQVKTQFKRPFKKA